MAVTNLSFVTQMTTTETLDSGTGAVASGTTITQNAYNSSVAFTASTTPPVSKGVKSVVTLSSGSATIDLTNLTGFNGVAVTGNGLRVRAVKFKANASNVNSITIAAGSYTGLGASFSVTLPAPASGVTSPAECTFYDSGNGVAVSGSVKTFTLTGTGSTDNITFEVVFGT